MTAGKFTTATEMPVFPSTRTGRGERDQRPRLLDKVAAAEYLSVSTKTVERLIQTGGIAVVRLPASRGKNNAAQVDASRCVLIDVRDLDAMIERSKERSR